MADISLLKLLHEVAELNNQPFDYSPSFMEFSHGMGYGNSFKDEEGNEVSVHFGPYNDPKGTGYNVGFQIKGISKGIAKDKASLKYYLRIMTTVCKVIEEFIKKYKPEALIVKGADDNEERREQKNELYQIYINKNLPDGYGNTLQKDKDGKEFIYVYKYSLKEQISRKRSKELWEWIHKDFKYDENILPKDWLKNISFPNENRRIQ